MVERQRACHELGLSAHLRAFDHRLHVLLLVDLLQPRGDRQEPAAERRHDPRIRQGKPTSDFILKISRRITLFGALFLALLAVLPTVIYAIAGISLPFAASSLLIAVSVAMETMRQLESQMTMRHYKGFLN